ncbi:hypothetical protein QQ045_027793 [Rhodiola kirilowii]
MKTTAPCDSAFEEFDEDEGKLDLGIHFSKSQPMDSPRNPDNTNEGSGVGGRPVSSDGFIDMSRGLQRRRSLDDDESSHIDLRQTCDALIIYDVRSLETVSQKINKVLYGGDMLEPSAMAFQTKVLVQQYNSPKFKFLVTKEEGAYRWIKPDKGYVKINSGASCVDGINVIGVGCICRDEKGSILWISTSYVRRRVNILDAELLWDFFKAMQIAERNQHSKAIFEVVVLKWLDKLLVVVTG